MSDWWRINDYYDEMEKTAKLDKEFNKHERILQKMTDKQIEEKYGKSKRDADRKPSS